MTSSVLSPARQGRACSETTAATDCAGFGLRFHRLLNSVVGLEIPAQHESARLGYIAELTGYGEAEVQAWFIGDQVPGEEVLQSLLRFFLHHTHCQASALRVESWLRYGEAATPDPFFELPDDDLFVALQARALRLLHELACARGRSLSSYPLQRLLDDLCRLLTEARLAPDDELPEQVKAGAACLLKQYAE